jgi:hypothetical protein
MRLASRELKKFTTRREGDEEEPVNTELTAF